MSESDGRGGRDGAGVGGGKPAYVRPVVETYSADEILAEFGPALACSAGAPCGFGDGETTIRGGTFF